MSETRQLLLLLKSLGVRLWVDGDRLRFRAPRGSMSPELVDRIEKHKQEILILLASASRISNARHSAIRAVSRSQPLLPSYAQERLWFLDQLEGQNATYVVPLAVHLHGRLNLTALEKALNEILRRHEVLRTSFVHTDGIPMLSISRELTANLSEVDLRRTPHSVVWKKVRSLAKQQANRSFDLTKSPLVRNLLIRLDDTEYVLLLTMHHIISDGWSVGVLHEEMAALYNAISTGRPSPFTELTIQYADFAAWQREWLKGEVLRTQLDYWKRQLKNAPPMLQLPTFRSRPAFQSYLGSMMHFDVDGDLTRKLRRHCQRSHATLFMVMLAAFSILLSRYSKQEDIVIGSPVANRNRKELEPLIGLFANTLALRVNLAYDPSFQELLEQVREVTLGAYDHQDLPFELLVQELNPDRDLSRNPLFQAMLVHHDIRKRQIELPGLSIAPINVELDAAKFDLTVYISERENALDLDIEYSTDLFDANTIQRIGEHLITLLQDITEEPSRRISSLKLLTESEKHQLLVEWNDTKTEFPGDVCIHQMFEAQVERTPEAIAVVFEDQQLTYEELNQRVDRLTSVLVNDGVGLETRLSLLAERSTAFLVSMLAIFKSGGTYLPLDPNHPTKHLAGLLQQSRPSFVLASRRFAPLLSEVLDPLDPARRPGIIVIDNELLEKQGSARLPSRSISPSNLAYVLFTSGSTGVPKGAMVEHQGMLNHLNAKIKDLDLSCDDTVAQTASQCFDISIWQFLAPLLVGARVHILNDEVVRSPGLLLAQVQKYRISILEVVPTMLRMLLMELDQQGSTLSDLSSLRWLIVTGEALPPELCRQWFSLSHSIPIMNAYGPTECSDDVTHFRVNQTPDDQTTILPIGRPIANTQIYIMDSNLRSVPIGITGELYVGGTGVGRGYLEDPRRTSEAFIPDPFSSHAGSRLYRTGDLARFLPTGEIQFLGRVDHQVKIRGYRIELGEIEAALYRHPSVRDAVVVASKSQTGDDNLIAYVVPSHGTEINTTSYRKFLLDCMPEHMVPAAFVLVDDLPKTPNGKIDRNALPEPEIVRPDSGPELVHPRNLRELQLMRTWSEVLSVKEIGIYDNFFQLGGDSFKAVRVVHQLRGVVTLVELFQNPTIAALAQKLESERSAEDEVLQKLTSVSGNPQMSMVCIPYASGNAVVYYPLAKELPDDYMLYSVALPGHDYGRSEDTCEALPQVAARCVREIKTKIEGPLALYGHCVGTALTVEIARLLEDDGVEVCAVFLGGGLPFQATRSARLFSRFERFSYFVPDRRILEFLGSLDGFEDLEDPSDAEQIQFMLRNFRHDALEAAKYFENQHRTGFTRRLSCPLYFIVGDKDPVTEDFGVRAKEWELFANLVTLEVISEGGHYFVKHQADHLAHIITNRLNGLLRDDRC